MWWGYWLAGASHTQQARRQRMVCMAPVSAVVALVQTGQRHILTEEKSGKPFMVVMEKLIIICGHTIMSELRNYKEEH